MTMSHDLWILALAYAVSVIGSLIGLGCMQRARQEDGLVRRSVWIGLGAVAIGGIAIWLMHFIAMLDFSVPGSVVTYSVPLTVLSAVLSIIVVHLGLSIATLTRFRVIWLLCAGILAGLGVAVMHYVGMAAVQFQGSISYDQGLVALSVGIAVVAATAAFCFVLMVRSGVGVTVAGLVMGVAVTGMHYTGMAAANVRLDPRMPSPAGSEVFSVVFPTFVLGALVIAGLVFALLASVPDPMDRPAPQG
jgi:NO-binding membrane sensor protein with MHYT domain